jgi:acyl carrier protein
MTSAPAPADTTSRIKEILRRDLKLGAVEISDDQPLFGGELDLDSLDVLLLVTSIEKEFGVKVPSRSVGREVFMSVHRLAAFLEGQKGSAENTSAPATKHAHLGDLLSRLPHRDPFRFVTRLIRVEPGVEGEAVWQLSGREDFFAGHFPGRPLVPGVLIAEALAQLSGMIGASAGDHSDGIRRNAGNLAMVNVRFRQPVAPPAEIILRSRLTQIAGGLRHFEVQSLIDVSVVAEGAIALHMT